MCLTIPKKVIAISDSNEVTVEMPDGARQIVKSIVTLEAGDFCLTQQNVAIYKLEKDEAQEALDIFQKKEGADEK